MTTEEMRDAQDAYNRLLDRHEACRLGRCSINREGECPEIWELRCFECRGFDGVNFVMRRVTGLGPVVAQRFDPTQSYQLECGHTTI